ncbi:MAG TPA: YceI family protein [Polyangia bacterium]|jgi:hypothetical protein
MRRVVSGLGVVTIGLLLPLLAHAGMARITRAGTADVSFTAVGPAGLKIVGRSGELRLNDGGDRLIVSVPLKTVATGITLRDEHMRNKYLHVDRYPDAVLEVARAAVKLPAAGGEVSGEASGTMRLHGRDKLVSFRYTARSDGKVVRVTATTRIDMRDHGIEQPRYLGLTVKPEVEVHAVFAIAVVEA